MKTPMVAFFLIGCGSADTSFGASNTLEIDGSADAWAVMGGAGGSAGSRASGGAVNTGGRADAASDARVPDPTCGPKWECRDVRPWYQQGPAAAAKTFACAKDEDCCRGTSCRATLAAQGTVMSCIPVGCRSDDECPCGMRCPTILGPDTQMCEFNQ